MQPALFLPHGAPDLAIADIPAAVFLRSVLNDAKRPDGIVIISAHWETAGLEMTSAPTLSTIRDFGGFSQDLYAISYPAKTNTWLIETVEANLRNNGISVTKNTSRGLDHGAWIPLRLAVPAADIPVVQISLPRRSQPAGYFEFGRTLSALSAQNILVIGSGASVHNLQRISPESTSPPKWAEEFDDWVERTLAARDWSTLFEFAHTQNGRMCHPAPEHFLPLLMAAGAGMGQNGTGQAQRLHRSCSYGSIGMSAWAFTHEA
ncbi:DODA-type extradiol aromatic ring-opening family dioxygenase [Maritalea sp.]|uniref:DODA-type extradiol aromatic ring-opening family dioxygenase n=1 Tax=Maritalea sp. TaxID=2003361 RepID=UPI003EF243A6